MLSHDPCNLFMLVIVSRLSKSCQRCYWCDISYHIIYHIYFCSQI